ncbi:MAG: hypothetical protein CFH25_00413 [Alphaproteobacteria bacterium MarineAlpha6_Bin3]|nr:MAG: hypothetical protein CFH25_00413 [Alphaproteobacteria bacterium MarineAlpha6_Bin3]|tara:strand:- start:11388 stop:12863 length:1476 start_codon:yes stop_codon:yes gene_type:complete
MNNFFLYLKFFLKKTLQNSLIAYVVSFIILLSLKKLNQKKKIKCLKFLIFSDKRWKASLDVLKNDQEIALYKIPNKIIRFINTIFYARNFLNYSLNNQSYKTKKNINEEIAFDKPISLNYYMEKDKQIIDERKKKEEFIKIISKNLSNFANIDCGITCGLKYTSEQAWASGFHNSGIPFISLFKEYSDHNTYQLEKRFDEYNKVKQKFPGTAIGVINENIKKVIKKKKLFLDNYVENVGNLRFDHIFPRKKKSNKKKSITLFMSTPFTTNLQPKKYARSLKSLDIYKLYFSEEHNEGFAKMFLNTYKIFIKLAEKNKDINFYIKPKRLDLVTNKRYRKIIEDFVKRVTGKNIKEIKNLKITDENSLNLIEKSNNIICFNSTIVLESVALGVAPIVPIFDEPKTKYKKDIFYNEDKDIVYFVDTHNKYIKSIDLSLKNKLKLIKNKKKINSFFIKYLNCYNPDSRKQTILFIKKVIKGYKANLFKQLNKSTY